MTQPHEKAKEFAEAAVRLRVDSDWKKLREMIESIMADLDHILRYSRDDKEITSTQGGRMQLQQLLDYVDNAQTAIPTERSGRSFGN